jgi:SHS2 domain-containing protein
VHNNPQKLPFEFFDVTADIGYRAYGETLNGAFENAGMALFEVITDTSVLKQSIKKTISLTAEDEKALLFDWLNELIFLHDAEYLVFSRFQVDISGDEDQGYQLEAEVWGEEFEQSRHESRDEVKAVTYHLMEVEREDGYRLQVILDV